jgi:hypothetical protein
MFLGVPLTFSRKDVLEHCEGLLTAERSGEIEEWRKLQNLQDGS